MPPLRYRDNQSRSGDQTDKKVRKHSRNLDSGEPGVQKLKSALRQTSRLLAKDSLAADVRVETERRLKSLEADLAKAQTQKKERTMAVRYHKIKFFDRQKVNRKIKQAKRALEVPELDETERKQLQDDLLAHRVDLNYILNFPKLEKYIALYPSGESSDENTDKLREEQRLLVRQAMERGEMDAEPEMRKKGGKGLNKIQDRSSESDNDDTEEQERPKPAKSTSKRHHSVANLGPVTTKEEAKFKSDGTKGKQKAVSVTQQHLVSVEDDDFFDA